MPMPFEITPVTGDVFIGFLIEIVKVIGVALGVLYAYLAAKNAKQAVSNSKENTVKLVEAQQKLETHTTQLDKIKNDTDGMRTELVETTRKLGEEHAAAEHLRGKEEARKESEEKHAAVMENALQAVAVAAAAVPANGLVPMVPAVPLVPGMPGVPAVTPVPESQPAAPVSKQEEGQ